MNTITLTTWTSPIGELLIGTTADGHICLCDWANVVRDSSTLPKIARALDAEYVYGDTDAAKKAVAQLKEYFAGSRREFDISLKLIGTDFQRSVWSELLKIPYGITITYGTLAARVGNPKAQRAVGMANSRNPICIIVPCHRVVASQGRIGGYTGGIDIKEALLSLESSGNFVQCQKLHNFAEK